MEFTNKKVIVTGANRSIGRQIAIAFAEQGADIVISYRSDKSGAEETVKAIHALGRKAWASYADFSNHQEVVEFYHQARSYLERVDVLINNAGMLYRETLMEITPEKMQQVLQVNALSPLYLLQLTATDMIQNKIKGCVINISSISASMTASRGIVYAASKAAMNKWTQNAALELAKDGIRVNTIAPGVIAAGMNEDTEISDPTLWQQYLNSIPLKKAGTPNDIANMVTFLASNKADWITGKIFHVDGGHVL